MTNMRYAKMALIGVVVMGLGLAGCQQQGPKQTIGTLGGEIGRAHV